MDASGAGLGAALLQTRNNTSCLKDTQTHCMFQQKPYWSRKRYSNIEREVLDKLYMFEKFHHDCFVREVSIITDHKPLVTIFKKDVAILSTLNSAKNTSIQSKNHIQAWTRSIHSGQAIQTKPQQRQRCRKTG